MKSKKNKQILRVWHIPQVPGRPFYVPVDSLKEAKKILDVLANYDSFQFENNIKPDYSNAAGLEEYIGDNTWQEWEDEDGNCIDDFQEEGE